MRIARFFVFAFLLIVGLVSCRRGEEAVPTLVPTAIVPEAATSTGGGNNDGNTSSGNTSGDNTVVSTPIPTPTVTPEPVAVTPVDPAAIDWPPQLVYSSPAPGEEVLLDGAITVRFDQPMDQESVEGNFQITAVDETETAVVGTFTWPDEDTLVFTPSNQFKRKQQYRVRIDEARGQNGQPLREPVTLDLQTVGFLEVSQVIPDNEVDNVQVDSAITVLFNRPVVPLVSSSQQAELPQPLTIEPSLAGRGEWISTSIYRFVPDAGLAGATTYQVTLDGSLTDVTGGQIDEAVTWQFTTLSPRVEQVSPASGTTDWIPTDPIELFFNMPMDRTSTEAAIALRSTAATAVVDFEWRDDDRVVTITPETPLQLNTTYQVIVAETAQAASGQATVAQGTVSPFTTVGFPAVVRVNPSANVTAEQWQRGFSVEFSAPIDPDTVEDRILIEPAPQRANYFFFRDNFELSVEFTLARSTEYVITIPGDVADPYGNTLGQDFTWRFTSPGYQPIASLNLPSGNISQLSTSFETLIDVVHVNVSQLDVALYDMGLALNLINSPYDVYDYQPEEAALRTWSIPIQAERDEVGVTPLYPAGENTALTPGIYLLTLDAPEPDLQSARFWQNQRQLLIVADTNIVVKAMFESVHVWVTDLASGQPVAERELTLYNERGAPVATTVSDANGFASFDYNLDSLGLATVVSGLPGASGFGMAVSGWSQGVEPWQFELPRLSYGPELPFFAYVYTDRPIYRPGDTMYYKGIVRVPNYGRYNLPEAQSATLTLASTNYFVEERTETELSIDIQPDGTFSGEYVLPETATLGGFQLSLVGNGVEAYRDFTVAEYRRPEFLVTAMPNKAEALRGESVEVVVEAKYFFGGSASDLTVNWNSVAVNYQPALPGLSYYFGDSGTFFYRSDGLFGGFNRQQVANGEGRTDKEGRFIISLPADLLKDVDEGSHIVTIEATITDLSNFPVSAQTSVILHAANSYVGVAPTNYVATVGRGTAVDIVTVDWQGVPVADQLVEVVFYRREWERLRLQEFGTYYTDWQPTDSEVARATLRTDAQGEGVAAFTPEEGGTYIAVATVTDENGRQQTSSSTIWAVDPAYAGWRTDPRSRTMALVLDKEEYVAGETASVLVQSPFADPVQAWLTIDRGELMAQQLVTLDGGTTLLDIPITADMAPNVYVSLVAVKGVDFEAAEPFADIRLGVAELLVTPEQLRLNIELTPRSERFEPRETVTYDITVTDYLGNPVVADLSLALVDLAVLTLKEDNAPDIHDAFYAPLPYRSQYGSGLFISGEGIEIELPTEGGGMGGGGGGDVAERSLALDEEDQDDDVRRDFPDTAFWTASVTTDENGRVSVDVPLPDSLTTWRLSSKGVTAATLVGQASTDIVVTKPLLVRPVTPRFFTVGDVVQIGAIVNNNSGQDIEVTASLEATGVTLNVPAEVGVRVRANDQQLVSWEVVVDDVTAVDLTFRVNGGGFSDATKPTVGQGPDNNLPVYRYVAEDIVGTAGVLSEAGQRVEAVLLPPDVDVRQGSIEVQLSPSLAAALIDALDATNAREFETVCAHSVANRLLPNVATMQAVQRLALNQPELASRLNDMIQEEIAQLESLAKANGGWGWCYSNERDPLLTAHILFALLQAEAAGYDVPRPVMSDAAIYLADVAEEPTASILPYRVNQQIFMLYVLAQMGQYFPDYLDLYVTEYRSTMSPYAKALLALTYEVAAPLNDNRATLLADLGDDVVLSATGAHWEDENRHYSSLSTDIRSTAMVLSALTQLQPDNELSSLAVRWLMAARQAQMWPTAHETAWTIFALTNWMVETGDLDANYEYALLVNMESMARGRFSPADVLASDGVSVPVAELVPDGVNYLAFERAGGAGRLYYTAYLNSFTPAATTTAVSRGLTVQRTYYDAACDPEVDTCQPITSIVAGQQVRVELTIIAPNDLLYATVADYLPAGAEAIDPNLDTSASGLEGSVQRVDEGYRYGYWGWWYFNNIEYRDDRVQFFANFLPAGTYQYTYFLQASIPGAYQVRPTLAKQSFFPEVFGRADGLLFTITE